MIRLFYTGNRKETYSSTGSSLPGLRLKQLGGRQQPGQCTEQLKKLAFKVREDLKEPIGLIGVGLSWVVCAN